MLKRLFTLAIFLSATLLFMVQPLTGRILLPVAGGSPAVWSTCMVFFQAVLLLGYLYAHALATRLPGHWQWAIHAGVLLGASILLPLPIDIGEPGGGDPRWWVLQALARTVGPPFFALSATAPLLQRWFSRTSDPRAGDPYFLYAASNAGSVAGLLAYLLIEPFAARSAQATGWAVGFWLVAVLVAACGYLPAKAGSRGRAPLPAEAGRTGARRPHSWLPASAGRLRQASELPAKAGSHSIGVATRALWIVLAMVPSTLLIGVTQHIATDVVSAPFLWVAPLVLYLATFMAAFSTRDFGSARRWGAIAPGVALLVLVLSLAEVRYPILLVTLAHLAAFTVLTMLCHTRVAESRPGVAHLTGYFVCISLGGLLGGVAAALVAPAVFSSILEYPIAIAAAVLLRPQSFEADRMRKSRAGRVAWRAIAGLLTIAAYWCVSAFNEGAESQALIRASFAVPVALLLLTRRTALLFAGAIAGLLVGGGVVRTGGEVLHRERTFFGVHQVTSVQNGEWHLLTHGTTTHGVQAVGGRVHHLPTGYYHPSGPIGDVVFTLVPDGRFRDVAVVGLGAGALAAYAGQGVRMDFLEIDKAVIRIAEEPRYFTYLSDAKARPGTDVRTLAVDGRLGLRAMPPASYDLIVIDAFSSDVVPTHLITREAVAMYESRLKPRGLAAFHISSRFFDLAPVLARIAADQRLVCYVRHDEDVPPERAAEGMRASVWAVLARDETDLGQLARSGPRWRRLTSNASDRLWTDDYTNVLGVLQR